MVTDPTRHVVWGANFGLGMLPNVTKCYLRLPKFKFLPGINPSQGSKARSQTSTTTRQRPGAAELPSGGECRVLSCFGALGVGAKPAPARPTNNPCRLIPIARQTPPPSWKHPFRKFAFAATGFSCQGARQDALTRHKPNHEGMVTPGCSGVKRNIVFTSYSTTLLGGAGRGR
jgi:hypothetical protein